MAKEYLSKTDALNTLVQIYLSHTSKWYSSVVATFIGAFGIPLLVFNLQLTLSEKIREVYLHIFSLLTIIFLIATLYFLHKVIYSLQFLEELYKKLIVIDEGKTKNLIAFRNEIMNVLKSRSKIFNELVKREKEDPISYKQNNVIYYLSIFVAIFGGMFLLSLIWIPYNENWHSILIWEMLYLIFNLLYLIKKPI